MVALFTVYRWAAHYTSNHMQLAGAEARTSMVTVTRIGRKI